MKTNTKERKNNRIGAIVSVSTHVLLILLFFFLIAWRAPDPPLPEIGIELNFGLDDAGSGEKQPEPYTQPSDSESEEEAIPDGMEETPEEEVEEVLETVTEPTETNVTTTEEVVSPVNNTQESPDVVEEKPVSNPVEKTKTPPVLYPNNKPGSGGKNGEAKEAQNANHGDKPNQTGDQGDKDGTVDSRALYGNAGGGGGTQLHMSGWMWDFKPKPNDKSSESGKLVFQVVIDDRGNIVRVKTVESSVSPSLEKMYRDEVMKLTFSKTAGTSVAASSTGTITFVIKAR